MRRFEGEEPERISFPFKGRRVSFKGFFLGSHSTAWDPVEEEERRQYDVYELYVDVEDRYHLVVRKGRMLSEAAGQVVDHVVCRGFWELWQKVGNTPAAELLKYFKLLNRS